MLDNKRAFHGFPPCFDENSEILILGSFPSMKSREVRFFYGNPKNRFWPMITTIYNEPIPPSVIEKRDFLLRHKLALYDVVESCFIRGSSDSSIDEVEPADLKPIIKNSKIRLILLNGKTAERFFLKYQQVDPKIKVIALQSTSPANAGVSLQELIDSWSKALKQ